MSAKNAAAKKKPRKQVATQASASRDSPPEDNRSSSAPSNAGAKQTNEDSLEDDANAAHDKASGGGQEPGLTPLRLKAAELATQLVCAQIAASFQHRSARDLATAHLKVAEASLMASVRLNLDIGDLKAGRSLELIDQDYVEQACQRLRQAASILDTIPSEAPALDHPDLDAVFAAAMDRANSMLRSPRGDRTIIYAEQLFPPDKLLSANKIRETFTEWNWPVLKNQATFVKKMDQLERWYADRYSSLLSGLDGTKLEDDLVFAESAIEFLNRHDGEDGYRNLGRAINELVSRQLRERTYASSNECTWDAAWQRSLILLIFNGREPGDRTPNTTREYNAWGLFRYLRVFGGEDEKGGAMHADFQHGRHRLNPDKCPGSIAVSHARCFGLLGDLAETKLLGEKLPAD